MSEGGGVCGELAVEGGVGEGVGCGWWGLEGVAGGVWEDGEDEVRHGCGMWCSSDITALLCDCGKANCKYKVAYEIWTGACSTRKLRGARTSQTEWRQVPSQVYSAQLRHNTPLNPHLHHSPQTKIPAEKSIKPSLDIKPRASLFRLSPLHPQSKQHAYSSSPPVPSSPQPSASKAADSPPAPFAPVSAPY